MRRALWAAALGVALLGCEPPPVFPTADERQNTETARIEGRLVVTGTARGNAVLLLFAADRPPPPEGTGRPLSFAVVPGTKIFGAALAEDHSAGPFTAPFAFDLVPEGRYLIKGFLDRDGCVPQVGCRKPGFIPWYGVTAEPNAGDVGGAAVDAVTRAPRVLEVRKDEEGELQPVTGVHVSFSEAAATVPADRPSFRVDGEATLDLAKPVAFWKLIAQAVDHPLVQQTAPTFLLRYADADQDGVPDDTDSDGVPELWPRVVVRKLADKEPPLWDENDLNRDGVLDAEGADYEPAGGTKDGAPDAVVLAAGLRPDTAIAQLTNPDGTPRMAPLPVSALDLAIRPLALDAKDPLAPALLKEVPKGRYAVIVIQFTGQTWRVPNELGTEVAAAAGLPEIESQAFFLTVP